MRQEPTTRIFWAVAFAVILIALGSFSLSFLALRELAAANGVPAHLAFIWPLLVDVSVIVFTAAILVSQLQHRGAKLAIGLTSFYAIVTIVGNLLHAPMTWLGWFVAVLPPLSLIFATEMLRAMAHHNIRLHSHVNTLAKVQAAIDSARAELDTLTRQIDAKEQNLRRLNDAITQAKLATNATHQAKMSGFVPGDLAALDKANQARDDKVAARRQQVLHLLHAGYDKAAIAGELEVSTRTITRDIQALNGQVQQ